jgi:hypothetical protein
MKNLDNKISIKYNQTCFSRQIKSGHMEKSQNQKQSTIEQGVLSEEVFSTKDFWSRKRLRMLL